LHRKRRSAINQFFSKSSISKLQPEIQKLAQKLCDKLLAEAGNEEPIDLAMAYSGYTTDVISLYCFGQSKGFLDQEGFQVNLREGIHLGCNSWRFAKQFPAIFYITDTLPE
jgi:cytochrome P450